MKFNFLKICSILILSFVTFSTASAKVNNTKADRTYIVRITSVIPGKVQPISGSYMLVTENSGTAVSQINASTPYEIRETASFMGGIFYSSFGLKSKLDSDSIKVEYLYKDSSGEHPIIWGTGFAVFSHTDSDGNAFVTAG